MPSVSIRLTKEQLEQLQDLAANNMQTINDYILEVVLHITPLKTKLTLEKVTEMALGKSSGSEFSIPSLFSFNDWQAFDQTDKRIVGRTFYQSVQNIKNPLSKDFSFVGKASHVAIYKRL